jgi:hypothetical protein
MNILKDNLNFLDIKTLKQICDKYNIDYHIYIEINNNQYKKINDTNHKEIIIKDILYYLKYNKLPKPTIYKKKIQNYNISNNLLPNNYIYYGQYKTTNKNILKLLKLLTNNLFHFGAISQKIVKYNWKKNKLLTYDELGKLWMKENSKGNIKYDELAYNQFMKKIGDKTKWFELKNKKISEIKKILNF